MSRQFGYIGEMNPYPDKQVSDPWGSFWLRNRERSNRPPRDPNAPCPFCRPVLESVGIRPISSIRFKEERFIVIGNHNPIVEGQVMVIPEEHRTDLTVVDFRLILEIAEAGFSNLDCAPFHPEFPELIPADDRGDLPDSLPYAIYVNTGPGTGRSVPHLHLNGIPADFIPLPTHATPAPWQICRDARNGTTFSRLDGMGFYALVIEGTSPDGIANTLAHLDSTMREWEIPYNLLAYPDKASEGRIVVVPRDEEYCDAADQKVAGQEFLTGILIPGPKRQDTMNSTQRDLAFAQATLKDTEALEFERRLRDEFGIAHGKAVFAVKNEDAGPAFLPVIRPNDVIRDDKAFILVRITRASICRTDIRALQGNKTSEFSSGPKVLGHEGGGDIVEKGTSKEFHVGQKVVILPHVTCQQCSACRNGLTNLCKQMKHLGLHLHGTFAEVMTYPPQCIFPVDEEFPSDAMPLVEPLGCVIRAISHIDARLAGLSDADPFVIYGAGPMGCLVALHLKSLRPSMTVKMVEPVAERRSVVQARPIADEVIPRLEGKHQISLVACSELKASMDAVENTQTGGTVVLFSGINHEDFTTKSASEAFFLEFIHRNELRIWQETPVKGERINLVGSSGYTRTEIKRSVDELIDHYDHYRAVQNVEINGLTQEVVDLLFPVRDVKQQRTLKALIKL